MTEKERFDLCMSTKIGDFISDEFKTYLLKNGFFSAPASTKYHGAYEGGLFDHSLAVMNLLVDLSYDNFLMWDREESPFIVGMFHDLCKIDCYRHPIIDELSVTDLADGSREYHIYDESKWEYNPDTNLKGHGDKSIILLSQFMTLTEEEIMCIRYHMGAFTEKEEWSDYTRAVHKYPNVLWTHHADMLASHVKGV